MVAIGGAIPGAGSTISALAAEWAEGEQEYVNNLFHQWMKIQQEEIEEIGKTIVEVMMRLDQSDEKVRKRTESKEYLSLLKKVIRDWSAAESEEKRIYIRNLLISAASPESICPDDTVRIFIDWIDTYTTLHLRVVEVIYKSQGGITRLGIWNKIDGERVRDDSHKADLFKTLIHDLSTGHIIRQKQAVDGFGRALKQTTRAKKTQYKTSAFDDEKIYVLTSLGQQFVHYVMHDATEKLAHNSA